jgi:hypothetical protein
VKYKITTDRLFISIAAPILIFIGTLESIYRCFVSKEKILTVDMDFIVPNLFIFSSAMFLFYHAKKHIPLSPTRNIFIIFGCWLLLLIPENIVRDYLLINILISLIGCSLCVFSIIELKKILKLKVRP